MIVSIMNTYAAVFILQLIIWDVEPTDFFFLCIPSSFLMLPSLFEIYQVFFMLLVLSFLASTSFQTVFKLGSYYSRSDFLHLVK